MRRSRSALYGIDEPIDLKGILPPPPDMPASSAADPSTGAPGAQGAAGAGPGAQTGASVAVRSADVAVTDARAAASSPAAAPSTPAPAAAAAPTATAAAGHALRYKCRLLYGESFGEPEISPYKPRPITSLKIVRISSGSIDYSHKYADRTTLARLFEKRGECDDIIIIVDGMVNDGTYANLAFLSDGCWYTPDTPLLRGTMREHLIETGVLTPLRIGLDDIIRFSRISLINAMLDLGEIEVSVNNVSY